MLVNIYRRDGTNELKQIVVGSNLTGARITSIVLENPQEVKDFLDNKEWVIRQISSRFVAKLPSQE